MFEQIEFQRYILYFLIFFVSGCLHEQIVPNAIVKHDTCTFTYQSNTAKTVTLVGSFNNWNPENLPMKRIDENRWVISITLPAGIYYYQFVINGKKWVVPPYADMYTEDGFGGKNAVVIVGNNFKK